MPDDGKTPVFLSCRARLGAVAGKYLGNPQNVEDALQEPFLRTWRRGRPDATPEQRKAFMFRSLRNICVDLIRRRRSVAEAPEDSPELLRRENAVPDPVESADLLEAVRSEALRSLSGPVLRVFELYTFEELDYAEISLRLGIPPETARSYMCRARKIMRERCSELLKR